MILITTSLPTAVPAQEADAIQPPEETPPTGNRSPGEAATNRERPEVPLVIEVEGRPLVRPQDVLFYGDRVPRSHFHGDRYVSERRFFEIAGDSEAARRSRNHRAVNIGLGALSIMSFFAGLALFSTADDFDLTSAGISSGTTSRGFSFVLVGGSLVPAVALTVRRQYWAPLEYTYQTMEEYNGADDASQTAETGVRDDGADEDSAVPATEPE